MKRFLPLIEIILLIFLSNALLAKSNAPPPPVIVVSSVSGNNSTCAGTPSASPSIQQFNVSGNNLTSDITATASANFEISLNPTTGYAGVLTLTQTLGTVSPTTIYVRLAGTAPVGNLLGNVTLQSAGAVDQGVTVTGIVAIVPTINPVAGQVVYNGYPTLPVNFSGTNANTFNWVNDTPGIGLPASGSGNIPAFIAVNKGTKSVVATITVTSSFAGFAYIANTSSNTISVINTLTQQVVGTISESGIGPRGVAVSPDGSRVYIANSSSNTLSIISTATNTEISNNSASVQNPSGVAVSPDGNTLYVTNYLYNTVSVINALNNNLIASVFVGKNPFAVAVSPDGSEVFVANNGTNTISVISTATNTVSATIVVDLAPQGIAISPDGGTVYVTNSNAQSVSVINAKTNTVTATIPVGIDPWGIAMSPNGNTVYVANNGSNSLSVINTATNTVTNTITVGVHPFGVSVMPDGSAVYVTDYGSDQVSVVDATNNVVLKTLAVQSNPYSLGNFIEGDSACPGAPIKFNIVVEPTPPVVIRNTFTPNGDGVNDTWDIQYIEAYPKCKVQIFNRYGIRLFYSIGYPKPWDGNYNGRKVPDGTYYYVIDLAEGFKPLSGYITVVR